MPTIFTLNAPRETHVQTVMADMKTMGPPTIRAIWTGDAYDAIEGSHRVEAAYQLGLPVRVIEVEADTVVDDHDLIDDLPEVTTAGDIAERITQMHGRMVDVEIVE